MSWSVASLLILACALAVGFVWYERSRPSPKIVALVATLAALAALGRIAFAPIPNVKPTTDIVLIAGMALGGAPGFVVGAVAALASNVFFGQGTWTPWQMFAWGAVGLFGAALGHRLRDRIGRVGLAAACAVAGLGFGVVMNLSIWVTFTGGQTLGELLALSGAALPFDIAHAVGNIVFALAFGPALLRSLLRFRSRMDVRWISPPSPAPNTVAPVDERPIAGGLISGQSVAAVVVALVMCAGALTVVPSSARASSTSISYLQRAQNSDGGFGPAPGRNSTSADTGWVALGLAGAGTNPLDVSRFQATPLDFLRRDAAAIVEVGDLERTILVLAAAGMSPRAFAGRNLVAELARHRRRDGSFDGLVNLTAFGVMALRASGLAPSSRSVRDGVAFLVREQNSDGGWAFSGRGGTSGIDDTSAPIQAIVASSGSGSVAVSRAAAFLARNQNDDGGFPLTSGAASNAQSTAWAIQAFSALGRDPALIRHGAGQSPLKYLRSLTASNGAVSYSKTSSQTPVWVTAQVVAALAQRPFPIPMPARSEVRAPRPTVTAAPPSKLAKPSVRATTTRVVVKPAAKTPAEPSPVKASAAEAESSQMIELARWAGAFVGMLLALLG
ncbi:MAG: hypothetical protein NTV40_04355 [Solirubrobacterales bacterium]|nr:hypothetical protein [Solirubrobacterales bacterium]